MRNLNFIKEHGVREFIARQKKRIKLLETMIENFDDGRSRSSFCRAACLHDLPSLESSVREAIRKVKTGNVTPDDAKAKARILKEILNQSAPEQE